VRYLLGQDGSKGAKTLVPPFFTVFDRFPSGSKSKFARGIKRPTVFAGRAAVKKR